jgi:hypothetical protein
MYDYCSIATETLAFLYEMLKSHDLGHVRGHVIRISKLPKIAKIDSVRLAVLHYTPSFIVYNYIKNEILLTNILREPLIIETY